MTERTEGRSGLKRQIGLVTATALVVGEVVGAGIFLTPADMTKPVGSPFLVLVVWLVAGVMALCGAFCFGELAARRPKAGGPYVYLHDAFHPSLAFLYGWMGLLVLDPGLTAALATGAAFYAAYALGLAAAQQKFLAVALVVAVAFVNVRGLKLGGDVVRWLTFVKVALLLFIVVWGFGAGRGDYSNFKPFFAQREGSLPLTAALAGAFVNAFFSFGGWWDLSKLGEEVREPSRNLPRAYTYGLLVVVALYVLTSAAFVYLVPAERVAAGNAFAAQAGEVLFGPLGGTALACGALVVIVGSLLAFTMSVPRVYFAMARDRLFLHWAARLHPRYGSPARAIVIQTVLASALVVLGNFGDIIAYFLFAVVLFIGLTVAALFVLRREGDAGGFRVPLYPLPPLIYLLLTVLLLVLLASARPLYALTGLAVVAAGLPVYYFVFRRAGREPEVKES